MSGYIYTAKCDCGCSVETDYVGVYTLFIIEHNSHQLTFKEKIAKIEYGDL